MEHAYLEPEACSASYDSQEGLTVYAPTQSPFELRRVLSGVMDLPQENIRVIATPIGGGFGSKADPYLEAAAAVASCRLGRPVKITLSREESLGAVSYTHLDVYKRQAVRRRLRRPQNSAGDTPRIPPDRRCRQP